MAQFQETTLTAKGLQILAATQAGGEIKFTTIVFGDELLTGDLTQLTEIPSTRQARPVEGYSASDEEPKASIWTTLCGTGLTTGYFLRAAGLYCADPDDSSQQVLYAVSTVTPDSSTSGLDYFIFVAPSGASMAINLRFTLNVVVSAAASIVIDANPDLSGFVRSVNYILPDVAGNVNITPQDIGALAAGDLAGIEADLAEILARIGTTDQGAVVLGSLMQRLRELNDNRVGPMNAPANAAGGANARLGELLLRLTAARAANLDRLDTTISSRAPANTALSNAVWTDARAALLDNLGPTGSLRTSVSVQRGVFGTQGGDTYATIPINTVNPTRSSVSMISTNLYVDGLTANAIDVRSETAVGASSRTHSWEVLSFL